MKVNRRVWAGVVMTALVTLFLLYDGVQSLLLPAALAQEMHATGWERWSGPVVGGIAIGSAVIYAVPRTAVLGAILITGFLGGAISTHLRVGEIGSSPQLVCLLIGCFTWAGLWCRYPALRLLIPVSPLQNA
jgi:hypothetical protein